MQYHISKFNKVARVFLSILFIIMGLCFLIIPVQKNNTNAAMIVMGLLFFAFAFYIAAYTFTSILTVDDEGVTLKNLFSNRMLYYNEIKGFRMTRGRNTTYLIIVPAMSGVRKIRISSDFEKFPEIQDQLKLKIIDLDEEAFKIENEQVLSNNDFGSTDDEINTNRKNATKIARVLVVISGVMFFAVALTNYFAIGIAFAAILIIIASFYFIWRYKGLIQIFDKNFISAYVIIWPAILLSAGLLLIISIKCFGTICNYDLFWKPVVSIFIITGAIVLWVCKKTIAIATNKIGSVCLLIIFSGIFSYGATIFTNEYFDNSVPQQISVPILDKSISVSRKGHTSYWLKLPAWGIMQHEKQNQVSHDFYNSVGIGDTVHILFKEGRLNIPWYDISR